MTAAKKETITRWLIGFIWSVSLVGGTALFAVGSRWKEISESTTGVKEVRVEIGAVRDRVTRLESELAHLNESQREIKRTLNQMDERQRAEYRALMEAIRER